MKKIKLFNWMLVALMAFQFTSCSDEPLEGQFPVGGEGAGTTGPASFVAIVDGVPFTAATVAAGFTNGSLVINGIGPQNSAISLIAGNAGICTYDLSNVSNATQYAPSGELTNPFVTFSTTSTEAGGGMTIETYDEINFVVSGTFNFIGVRNITDSSGVIIEELVNVTQGSFTNVQFQVVNGDGLPGDCTGTGGGSPIEPIDPTEPVEPVEAFFAVVAIPGEEAVEHEDVTLITTSNMVGDDLIIKVEAQTATGALIRLDIPSDIGIGTFAMESDISDGTKLIGIYNGNAGGENLSSNPGEMTITTFNTTDGILEGTFFFTARDPLMQDPEVVEITEGSFTVFFDMITLPTPSPFSAVVDGLAFEPAALDIVVTSNEVNMIQTRTITATVASGREIAISLPTTVEAGVVYTMATEVVNGDEVVGTYTVPGVASLFSSNPGSLTVQEYDPLTGDIRATFTFTATDNVGSNPAIISITEGTFAQNIL